MFKLFSNVPAQGAQLAHQQQHGAMAQCKARDVYLNGYANMGELMVGLAAYMSFFNAERPHQSLNYETPDQVYRTGVGGGAIILDKFGGALVESSVPLRSTDDSTNPKAETEAASKAKPGQRRPAACGAESTA